MKEYTAVKVTGLDTIHAQLMSLQAEVAVKVLASAARKAFAPVLVAAKAKVPVWSGALRDSLKITVGKPSEGDTVVDVGIYVGRDAGYNTGELPPKRRWHFIELGTAKMAATPYLRPALDENAAAVIELLKTELQKKIDAAIRKQSRGK